MRFLPPEENITPHDVVFDSDLLGRRVVGQRLSSIVERIEDPLVIALDGRWGTGKSYFLKRWVGAHAKQNDGKGRTVYFDAFSHDYLSDPLIALVGALVLRTTKSEQTQIDRIKKLAVRLVKPGARIGLSVATFGATEALDEFGDAVVSAIGSEASQAMDEFWKKEAGRQRAMEEFRSAIMDLTNPGSGEEVTPLIIVVDELDRCRPDYALEVLEVIKHFFSVPRVHFVLGVNLIALENSVKARYGAGIDATAYLQKFLSFTMKLPEHIGDHNRTPATIKYTHHIGREMETPKHLLAEVERQIKHISNRNGVSIRDIRKVVSSISLLPEQAINDKLLPGWKIALITMVITKVVRQDLFEKMVAASASPEEIKDYFGATGDIITQTFPNGERNQNYSHELYTIFSIWVFLCSKGEIGDNEESLSIARLFSRFGDRDDVEGIPRRIFEEFLNDFSAA